VEWKGVSGLREVNTSTKEGKKIRKTDTLNPEKELEEGGQNLIIEATENLTASSME